MRSIPGGPESWFGSGLAYNPRRKGRMITERFAQHMPSYFWSTDADKPGRAHCWPTHFRERRCRLLAKVCARCPPRWSQAHRHNDSALLILEGVKWPSSCWMKITCTWRELGLEQRWRLSHVHSLNWVYHLCVAKVFTKHQLDAKHCASCSGSKGVNKNHPLSSRNSYSSWWI